MQNRWIKSALRGINLHPWWRRVQTPVWGSRLRAPTFDRWLALQLHRFGWMGVDDRTFLSDRIKPGMTVVDIGANQGLYTLLFARLTGTDGRVLAFEPDLMLGEALRENVGANGVTQVSIYPTALGSHSGVLTLYRSLLNSGDNRLAARSIEGGGPRDATEVAIERLDDVLAGAPIDFVKMDVQGWEMEVLRGMSGTLARGNPSLSIYFEYWPQGLRDAGSDPVEPLQYLVSYGFTIYTLDRGRTASPIDDAGRFARSIQGNKYVNLYATRSAAIES